ncbi:MAG TPA: hypothetical protein VGX03_26630 [Candidatus Binatia bacterium]|nr:hypothetical protein [Candidatus Binatia bacterium]
MGLRPVPELNERLAGMERVFRAPPFTKELVTAIKLIAPHFDFTTNEQDREIWEADQNGTCWGEYQALAPLFRVMPLPARILEIGPGLGRSLVFFSKKLGWEGCEIHTYEGEGSTTKYTLLGPRFADSFCGNMRMLKYVLAYNGIRNVTVFNARDTRLPELPRPYDFLYSFYGIGFHWSLEYFLEDILSLLHDEAIAVFTVPKRFTPFPRLEDLSYRIIDWKTVWPKDGYLKLLVLSKQAPPIWT